VQVKLHNDAAEWCAAQIRCHQEFSFLHTNDKVQVLKLNKNLKESFFQLLHLA